MQTLTRLISFYKPSLSTEVWHAEYNSTPCALIRCEGGKGGLQSSVSYRFKWIVKANVHIATKFLQVRCNPQAGHFKQPLSQIKSSHHYWCGNYALEKSSALVVQGERDLELSSRSHISADQVSQPRFTYCQERNHQLLDLFQKHIRKYN